MQKRLDRHIVITVCGSIFVVLLALLMIDLLATLIGEADNLGKNTYNFVTLMQYVFGLIPLKLIEFFPIALLIGALLGLGKMAAANELIVMQSSGVSRLRIGILGFSLAVILGALILLISEFLGVYLNDKVENIRANALGRVTNSLVNQRVWAQDNRSILRINGVNAQGEFVGIKIYTFDEAMQFDQVLAAERGRFNPGNWQLFNTTEKTFANNTMRVTHHETYDWQNRLDYDILTLLLSDPEALSLRDLSRYIQYQKANAIQPTNYLLIFWQRLLIPLTTGVMFLLALPFVFGSQRNSGQGRKLFIGILLGLAYFIAYSSIANIVLLTGLPVILGAISPILLFFLVSLVLLKLRH
ncbi:LPS export ABC transporter permease LptG [Ostreibacterium oceani]|uniref:LPS export ABC transporter permease LptG n=1 Tax=Ostreibacterium oceani TaxID=2654998 RepID=A0A6N7EYG9_9GAMM|nr:LPS export ABC transporter permease LptG [Ostreibacterium oceani]MPV86600.1 LPS export ABC transporter permease LptG [Ostreibacterium oceani]